MALLLWYPLNGDVLDYSGNNLNNLINSGATSTTDGKIGSAYSFTGTSKIYATSGYTFPSTISVCAWGYATDYTATMLFSLDSSSYSSGIDLFFYNSTIFWNTGDLATTPFRNNGVNVSLPSLNEWHHYCVISDGVNNKTTLYIDGEYYGEALNYKNTYQNNGGFVIGNYDVSSGYSWEGKINDVRVYDEVLSTKQIKELAKAKVLHYNFNDFQEPTENIIYYQNPRIDESYSSYVVTSSGTWEEKHSDAIRVYNTNGSDISYYVNQGVTDWTNTYHAIWTYDDVLNKPVVTMRDLDGVWKAKSFSMNKSMTDLGLSADDKYTISWLQWTSDISKSANVGVYGLNTSGSNNFWDGLSNSQTSSYNTVPNAWQRVYCIYTVNSTRNMTTNLSIFMYGHYGVLGTLKISDVQFETKAHPTPFVDVERDGTVKDSSGYNNNVDLSISTTPKWLSDSKLGVGAYEFDGVSQYITVPIKIKAQESKTYSAWVKLDSNFNSEGSIFSGRRNTTNSFYIRSDRTLYAGEDDETIVSTFSLNTDVWYHVAYTFNYIGDNVPCVQKLYINGVLNRTRNTGAYVDNYSNNTSYIGYDARFFGYFKGIIDDVRVYKTALSDSDVLEIYNVRASFDKQGNMIVVNQINETNHKPLILDYTTWQDGQTGSITGFGQNGSTSENYRILGVDPFGKEIVVWEARPDATSGADGGWNSSTFPIDNTKLYRFSVWVNRKVAGNGNFYLGLYGLNSSDSNIGVYQLSNGANNTNPYFYTSGYTGLLVNDWVLVVGHVFPYTHSGTSLHPDSGRYDKNGNRIGSTSIDFKWRSDNTRARHRSYLYYSTDTTTRQQWCYPRVDIIDGTEPTLQDLLNGFDSRNYDYIYKIGGTTNKGLDIRSDEIIITQISEVGISNNLKAYYPFDKNANDYSGNGYDGVVTGATLSQGIKNQCYSFDGVNDFITISNTLLQNITSFTISMWLYVPSFGSNDMDILWSGTHASSSPIGMWIDQGTNWKFAFLINDDSDNYSGVLYSNYTMQLNEWVHCCFTFENGNLRIHVNGIEDSTSPLSTSLTNLKNTTDNIIVGADVTPSRFFNGKIDNLRIYDTNLSDKEIQILYEIEKPNYNLVKVTDNEIYVKNEIKDVDI